MTVQVNYDMNLTVRETLTGVPAASNPTVTHNGYNDSGSLNSATSPPATMMAAFSKALAAGAGTIDLTALPQTNGGTASATGLKIQSIKVRNPSGSSNPLVIVPGASNGHNFLGASSKITLNPGETFQWQGVDSASQAEIGASSKTLDLSDASAGGTDSSEWIIVFG